MQRSSAIAVASRDRDTNRGKQQDASVRSVLAEKPPNARPLPRLIPKDNPDVALVVLIPEVTNAVAETLTQLTHSNGGIVMISAADLTDSEAAQLTRGQEFGATGRKSPVQRTHEPLTPREQEVLELLVQGKGNREIAQTLWVTLETVKAHLTSVYRKMNVKTRAEAIAAYFKAPR